MTLKINRDRLADTFTELCEISSPSRKEANIAEYLKKLFARLGADQIYEDGSADQTGSECGNLIIRFNGQLPEAEGLFLSCHMDTVQPGEGVQVVRKGNIFTSKGDTVLGGDDKSGIAAIIEVVTMLRENKIEHPMFEIVITTCEEIGLLGAKNLEFDKLQTSYGYALDSSGIDQVIIGAPAANKISVEIRGKAAHAGLCPEAGINALTLAANGLSSLTVGRLDDESTCNFGVVQGGVATNIVPECITLKGEVRSHSAEKLVAFTEDIQDTFQKTIDAWEPGELNLDIRPSLIFAVEDDYPALTLPPDAPVIKRVQQAAEITGRPLSFIVAGGGSDANIFCGNGLPTAIVATGMEKVHSLEEQLDLDDLVKLTDLVYQLILINRPVSASSSAVI